MKRKDIVIGEVYCVAAPNSTWSRLIDRCEVRGFETHKDRSWSRGVLGARINYLDRNLVRTGVVPVSHVRCLWTVHEVKQAEAKRKERVYRTRIARKVLFQQRRVDRANAVLGYTAFSVNDFNAGILVSVSVSTLVDLVLKLEVE